MSTPLDRQTNAGWRRELLRSPASVAIGTLAEASRLFMSHFERRAILPLPEHWLPEGRPDLGDLPDWHNGVLPEPKYQAFRHDCLIGSFHPGHRAKWTGHEFCHSLVGFAWKPNASPLFHALAARMAEVLPVALWYFFDEAGLRRCSEHVGGGPLFGAYCPDCEAVAIEPTSSPDDERWIRDGVAFVEREIDAILRSAETGRMVGHRYATLDLASDGLAYAAAHTTRLLSEEHARWVEWFCGPGRGHHRSLESMAARVRAVMAHMLGRSEAAPLQGDCWTWAAQDVAARLFQVAADTGGEAREELIDMCDALSRSMTAAGVAESIRRYDGLTDAFEMVPAELVFAVGYDLTDTIGNSIEQLREGLASALPQTVEHVSPDTVRRFVASDDFERIPLGRRFASFVATQEASVLVDVARLESALAHPNPVDAAAWTLNLQSAPHPDVRYRLSPAVQALSFDWDVLGWLDASDGDLGSGPSTDLVVLAEPGGELAIIPVTTASSLPTEWTARGDLDLSDEELYGLLHHAVLIQEFYLA